MGHLEGGSPAESLTALRMEGKPGRRLPGPRCPPCPSRPPLLKRRRRLCRRTPRCGMLCAGCLLDPRSSRGVTSRPFPSPPTRTLLPPSRRAPLIGLPSPALQVSRTEKVEIEGCTSVCDLGGRRREVGEWGPGTGGCFPSTVCIVVDSAREASPHASGAPFRKGAPRVAWFTAYRTSPRLPGLNPVQAMPSRRSGPATRRCWCRCRAWLG